MRRPRRGGRNLRDGHHPGDQRTRDPAALGQAIARVLDDPETAAGWARAARRLLEADFDFRDHARELQGIFAAAIASQDDRIYLGKCASEGGSAVA